MSKKPLVVKTYGRHKYRTVKAQRWLSPEETFLSPFGTRDQTRFPSKFESASSKNILKPKASKWGNATKQKPNSLIKPSNKQNGGLSYRSPTDHSDKENHCISPPDNDVSINNASEQRLKRKRQNLFSDCTPISVQRQQCVTSDSGRNGRKFDANKQEVVLVNDSLESRDNSSSHIAQDHACIQESKKYNSTPNCGTDKQLNLAHFNNVSNSGTSEIQSLDENVALHGSASSPKDGAVANGLENGNYATLKPNTSGFNRCQSSYVTSTPVFNVNNPPLIMSGNSCESDSQCSILMDGKVVLEPLRITPIQWKKCLSASNEKTGSNHSSHSANDSHQKYEEPKSSSITNGHNSSVELKECVVSLEKLRITPLKKRSRYHLGGITASDVCVGSNEKSHLSFVEALTPAKKKQTEWNTANKEEVELSALDKIMLECDQEGPVTFADFLNSSLLKSCAKIGEGVYGEVFKAQHENGESIALKIIPVEGDFEVNGTPQKSFDEILPEIVISKELSLLGVADEPDQTIDNISASFINVHSVTCCRDKYPKHLISEWDKWDKQHNSENDRPDIFPSDQYFIVFEFSNGGRDLESFEFGAQSEAWSVLHQTALGLAVAENALEFEHRDLHWGNVLICRTEDEFIESCLLGETKMVPTHGVRISLIDFTLSRLKKDGLTVFCNLAEDESLFTGKGDYQFDVYRLMKKATKNDWELFEPHTNALWLHYLADKILKKKKYPAKDKDVETKLKRFLRQARKCSSATEIVQEFFD